MRMITRADSTQVAQPEKRWTSRELFPKTSGNRLTSPLTTEETYDPLDQLLRVIVV